MTESISSPMRAHVEGGAVGQVPALGIEVNEAARRGGARSCVIIDGMG